MARCARLSCAGVAWALCLVLPLAVPAAARAGKNDLQLLNLCQQKPTAAGLLNGQVAECGWVQRDPGNGLVQQVAFDADAESRFRSLMSELGVVMAPRLVVPADTLGFSGFQVSTEVGMTQISNKQDFWNGTSGVEPQNPNAHRPPAWLSTVGVFVRKGMWVPLPAFEFGAGVVHLLDSQMLAWQGYAKWALHEGFHDLPLPSFAVRGSMSYVTGTDQARILISGVDLVLSKAFGLGGTARLEPFGGLSFLYISAKSGIIDATPSCDAYAVHTATMGQALGDYCASAQRGTGNDYLASFKFPDQDTITRHRVFGGMKLRFAAVFLTAQYEVVPGGRSRDQKKPNGATDTSAQQQSLSLSAGFDF